MAVIMITDDSKTSAGLWKDWSVTNLQQSEWSEYNLKSIDESEFTKEDPENSLKKVVREIKK